MAVLETRREGMMLLYHSQYSFLYENVIHELYNHYQNNCSKVTLTFSRQRLYQMHALSVRYLFFPFYIHSMNKYEHIIVKNWEALGLTIYLLILFFSSF